MWKPLVLKLSRNRDCKSVEWFFNAVNVCHPICRRIREGLAVMILLGMVLPGWGAEWKLQREFRTEHMVIETVHNAQRVFAGTRVSGIDVFSVSSEKLLSRIRLPQYSGVFSKLRASLFSLDLSGDGRFLAVASNHGKVLFYNPETLELARTLEFPGIDSLTAIRFVDDESFIAGTLGGEVLLAEIDGKVRYRRPVEYDAVNRLALSPDRSRFAVATYASVIRVFDTSGGDLLRELKGHKDAVYDLIFVEEHTLLSCGKDRRLLAWDLESGAGRELYYSDSYIHALAFSSVQGTIVFPADNHQLALMSWPRGEVFQTLSGHKAFVHSLRFSAAGTELWSGGNDSMVRLWSNESNLN